MTHPSPNFANGQSMQALAALNERAREIFRQIVESYLTTGEPVGSRNLARILPMALSPASIRNVMADLEHSGLIFAPHTSAGRLPTELGLRFFVDAMLELGDVSQDEQARIEAQMRAAASGRGAGARGRAVRARCCREGVLLHARRRVGWDAVQE